MPKLQKGFAFMLYFLENDVLKIAVDSHGAELSSIFNKAENKDELEKPEYDFHPQLFGFINLEAKASDIISPAKFSWSAVFMMVISAFAALLQNIAKMQHIPKSPS